MSYETINAKRYRCVCEAMKHGLVCGNIWETDNLPTYCSKCKSKLWNGEANRKNKKLTHNGKTQSVAMWAKELGISANTIHVRLWRGWAVEDALDPSMFSPGRHPKDAA